MHNDSGLTCESAPRPTRRRSAAKFTQLNLGLFGWGLGIVLFIRSHLGLGPWDAFHVGLHVQTGLSVGGASIAAGFVIMLALMALRVRPGIATLLNMVLIGVFIDLLLPVVPDAPSLFAAAAYFAVAVPLVGLSSGLYIGAGFGHGPRDSLMVMLALRSGWSVRRVRTLIELVVLAIGWSMGGTVGIGTLIIALTIGPSVQWGLRLFDALPVSPAVQPARRGRLRRAA